MHSVEVLWQTFEEGAEPLKENPIPPAKPGGQQGDQAAHHERSSPYPLLQKRRSPPPPVREKITLQSRKQRETSLLCAAPKTGLARGSSS